MFLNVKEVKQYLNKKNEVETNLRKLKELKRELRRISRTSFNFEFLTCNSEYRIQIIQEIKLLYISE